MGATGSSRAASGRARGTCNRKSADARAARRKHLAVTGEACGENNTLVHTVFWRNLSQICASLSSQRHTKTSCATPRRSRTGREAGYRTVPSFQTDSLVLTQRYGAWCLPRSPSTLLAQETHNTVWKFDAHAGVKLHRECHVHPCGAVR